MNPLKRDSKGTQTMLDFILFKAGFVSVAIGATVASHTAETTNPALAAAIGAALIAGGLVLGAIAVMPRRAKES